METYIGYIFFIPVVWFLCALSYQIGNLIYLWSKDKFSSIKEREFQLWD